MYQTIDFVYGEVLNVQLYTIMTVPRAEFRGQPLPYLDELQYILFIP